MRCLGLVLVASLASALGQASASTELAGEVLTVGKGAAPGEVVLLWTGGTSPWEVFRSTSPATVPDPSNRLATTTASSWLDVPPANEPLVLYQVVSCATPAAPAPHGCVGCDVCDTWGLSWAPVACTTHYVGAGVACSTRSKRGPCSQPLSATFALTSACATVAVPVSNTSASKPATGPAAPSRWTCPIPRSRANAEATAACRERPQCPSPGVNVMRSNIIAKRLVAGIPPGLPSCRAKAAPR